MTNPIRPVDDAARDLARGLLAHARHAALGVLCNGSPLVTRIALGLGPDGRVISLVSDLSAHTRALRETPACSLLVGDPGPRGDPLTHPRLSLQASARLLNHKDPFYNKMAAHYLRDHPKAKLYIKFRDFAFVLFDVTEGLLNGGFGKAYVLSKADLGLP